MGKGPLCLGNSGRLEVSSIKVSSFVDPELSPDIVIKAIKSPNVENISYLQNY